MELRREERGGWVLLAVIGDIDTGTVPPYRDALYRELSAGRSRIILDLTLVEFFDSMALGVTVGALKRARGMDGDVVVVAPEKSPGASLFDRQGNVRKNFEVTGLTKVFRIFSKLEDVPAS